MPHPDIEVHNWKEGDPRPGTVRKHRETCLESLELPASGAIPLPCDILFLPDFFEERKGFPVPYRVLEREFLYSRRGDGDNGERPLQLLKVMVHVRRARDYDDPTAQPTYDRVIPPSAETEGWIAQELALAEKELVWERG